MIIWCPTANNIVIIVSIFFIVFFSDVLLMNIVEFCNALSKACIPHTNTPLQSFVDDKLPCNIHLKKKKNQNYSIN